GAQGGGIGEVCPQGAPPRHSAGSGPARKIECERRGNCARPSRWGYGGEADSVEFERIETATGETRPDLALRRWRARRGAMAGGAVRTEALPPAEQGVKLGFDVSASEPPRSAMTPEIPFLFVHRRVTDDQICVLTFDR